MKKIGLTILSVCFTLICMAQQSEMTISTVRVGPYKINMKQAEAEKIAGKKLKIPTEANEYNGTTLVNYNNETLEITLGEYYENENSAPMTIQSIGTQSPLFSTLSGIKIGSTKDELFNAYKNFSNFSMHPKWNEDGTYSKTESFFSINDDTNQTTLTFSIKNGKVSKIELSILFEGC